MILSRLRLRGSSQEMLRVIRKWLELARLRGRWRSCERSSGGASAHSLQAAGRGSVESPL